MLYREVSPITRENAERAFASGNRERICDTLISLAYHDPEWRWVQGHCLHFAKNDSWEVRAIAATCLGHLARIHKILDLEFVLPVLRDLLINPKTKEYADDALNDIMIFLPISKEEAEIAFASDDKDTICHALSKISYHIPDWHWVQEQCLRFLKHGNVEVRKASIQCLASLALNNHVLNPASVIAALKVMLKDSEVSGEAEEAISDITLIMKSE
jgi:hypothetical protein